MAQEGLGRGRRTTNWSTKKKAVWCNGQHIRLWILESEFNSRHCLLFLLFFSFLFFFLFFSFSSRHVACWHWCSGSGLQSRWWRWRTEGTEKLDVFIFIFIQRAPLRPSSPPPVLWRPLYLDSSAVFKKKKKIYMVWVGFEPTRISSFVLETNALTTRPSNPDIFDYFEVARTCSPGTLWAQEQPR